MVVVSSIIATDKPEQSDDGCPSSDCPTSGDDGISAGIASFIVIADLSDIVVSQPRTVYYLGLRLSNTLYGADNLCFNVLWNNKTGYDRSSTPRETKILRGSTAGPGSPSAPLWGHRDPACDWHNMMAPTMAAANKFLHLLAMLMS